ncbi:MAG: SPOR domain-containing protein [Pseudomonadota bacterium]
MKKNTLTISFAALALANAPGNLAAQDTTSRAVVQPLPSPQVQRLNRALMELARDPNHIPALIEAGNASLAVDDQDAALGFLTRAAELGPNDSRVTLGLARVYLRSGRPIEAIPLFNAARGSGASERDILTDEALAFDLVGDQPSAQSSYARAIELNPEDREARRRLALSRAISGDETGFQSALAPLIVERDTAAIRARAFGLAILGQQERAEAIVDTVMPRDLASRINPYLAYMPRLTPAQQAAAANLGIFPRAADIGREDPRIARFASEGEVGALLEPAGAPLGEPTQAAEPDVAVETEPASVANAFADMDAGDLPVRQVGGEAVDISTIEIPREVETPPEPAPPAHPRRIWVQLATGRNIEALGFDWRRFVRQAPDLLGDFEPHVTPWGRANRLLAGPVESRSDARALVNSLAAKGIDTFTYTSPEGTVIQTLD